MIWVAWVWNVKIVKHSGTLGGQSKVSPRCLLLFTTMLLSKSTRYPLLRQAILGRRSLTQSIVLCSDSQTAGAATGNRKPLAKTDWSAAKPPKKKEWKRSPSQQQSSSVPKPRDWSLSAEDKQKMRSKEPFERQQQQRHRKDESASERRERKRREEEIQALMKEEELAKRRLAEKHAKEQHQSEAEKQIPDVYVPQVISVANLSRLFGVRLGRREL